MKTKLITISKNENNLVFNKPGNYVVFFSNISGNISCTIQVENVKLYMVGLYDMYKKDKYSIHTEQVHLSPHSYSDLLILSVARDNSTFIFSGLIRIEKDAQQSHAYQKNQNLILSEDAFVDSQPILEILANDVYCTHGSSSGPPAAESLAYLQMRGLTKEEAIKLSVEGFKQLIYDRLTSFGIKNI